MSYDSQTSTALVNKLRKDVDSLTLKIAVITDSKPSGTSGGAGVASSWTTRDLNTIDSDPHSLVLSLTSNQFTLAAGAYQINAMAAFLHTGHTRMLLYDVTGGVAIGYSVSVEVSNQANIYNELNVRVQPHKDNVYRLAYYISTAGADHLGVAAGLTGISEIYAVCEITRLDTGMTKPTGGSGIQGAPGPAGPAGPAGPVGPSGSGTVTLVSVVPASGVSGSVATPTTTPAITLTLGAITPTSVAASGAISAGATVTGSNLAGVNTGDQLIILTGDRLLVENSNFLVNELGDNLLLTGDITGSGTGRITAIISPQAVTYNQIQFVSASDRVLGRQSAGPGLIEEITCTAAGRALLDDSSAADQRTTLGAAASGPITTSGLTVSTTNKLLGRGTGGGAVEEISVGANLTLVGNTLSASAPGTGTVTSVNGSGSTTGLSLTGGPITTTGTLTLGGTLALTNGGTGATSAGVALTNLGAYSSANPSGFTSNVGTVTSADVSGGTTGLTTSGGPITSAGTITIGGTLAVTNGGTGAITAPAALTSLGAYPTTNPSGFTSNVGTVTTLTVTPANGVTGTVLNPSSAPAVTIILGAITPSSVAATGTVTGTNLTGTHTGTSSGTNTGDQAIVLSGDVSGSGSTGITTTIGANKVTYAMLQAVSSSSKLLGSSASGTAVQEITLGTNLSITGSTLNAAGSGSGTVTSVAISGGTTGLTTSGSPITTSGTVTLGGNLAIANGGTGAATAGGALSTLGAYSNTNPSGFTSNVGTVTTVSVTNANGVSGTVATAPTTPAITLILGAITPTSVAASGTVTGSNLSGTHTGTSSGTNTGDQNIALTGDVTGSGTTSFAATIANSAVTLSKLATLSANSRLLGSTPSGTSVSEIILGTNLSITGNTLNAAGSGSGTVTSVAISGGTTGLTTSGSPITTSGTVTLGGNLAIANGGTGAATAGGALTTLGAYSNTNPSGFTSNVGTVTGTSITPANGVTGTVANQNTTPAITIILGAITPTSVAATGTVTGTNLTGTHTGTSSGTNTGDQNIALTGDVTGSGIGSFTATIGSSTVTYAKMQSASGIKKIVGSNASSSALTELTLGSNMSITGNVLNATGTGTGDVVGPASATDNNICVFDTTSGKLIKQGAWRDDVSDFIGPNGSSTMTSGFAYIPKGGFAPSGIPINSSSVGANAPLYLQSNSANSTYRLWIHVAATTTPWKYVDLLSLPIP
jgi:Repeat of unknown function (DUF5907)